MSSRSTYEEAIAHQKLQADAHVGAKTSRFVEGLAKYPLLLFLASLWLIKPFAIGDTFSLNLMAPGLLLLGVILVRVPRRFVLERVRPVRFEFALLLLIVALSLLSIVNSSSPIRTFRIIYPSLLPFAVFAHLTFLAYFAPERILKIPRLMIFAAALFSVLPLFAAQALPPLKELLFGAYRMRGFFENSIQHSIVLGLVLPLVTVEFALAKTRWKKIALALFLLVMMYTVFRAGSKSVLVMSLGISAVLYLILSFRTRNFLKISLVLLGAVLLGLFVSSFGLMLAEKIDPTTGGKLRSIVEGGVTSYQSIESRKMLWAEAIRQGTTHWLIGTGAGEPVLGVTHAHNLILDYFKGIGVFGALAIFLLCATILFRTFAKALYVLRGSGGEGDIRQLACYFSASLYVFTNQLSDCFGPSTIGSLWLVYLTGVFFGPAWSAMMAKKSASPAQSSIHS